MLSVEGYNAVILLVPMIMEADEKATIVSDIYRVMAKNGIVPNIQTFDAALRVAATFKNKQGALDLARTVFADITKSHLKPSLTTYSYALQVLNKFGSYTIASS